MDERTYAAPNSFVGWKAQAQTENENENEKWEGVNPETD
jgi:hypothetical protein